MLEQRGTAAQLGRLEHHAPGAHRHGLAQRRELVALAAAVDQARAQVVFQGLDAAAQRRLREVLLLGGAAERAGIGNGQQVFQGSPNEAILAPLANAAVRLKAEDFRLVHPVADAVMVLLARKDLPANNVDELIALARKSGDAPLSYGSVGLGSLYHLILENVQQVAGIKLTRAPYKGNAPLLQDIGGGQVDFAVLVYSAGMGALAEQGRLKVIRQLGAQRSELLPNVPAVSEGKELKNFSYMIWSGLMVPKNTPENVVERLHKAIGATLKDPGVRSQLAAQTQVASAPMSLAESTRFFEAETARYRAIAKSINLQPQ